MEIEPHLLPLLKRLFYPKIYDTIQRLKIETIEEGVTGESSSEANLESIIFVGGGDAETDVSKTIFA